MTLLGESQITCQKYMSHQNQEIIRDNSNIYIYCIKTIKPIS